MKKKYVLIIVYSVLFLFIYFMLDYLSGGYKPMIEDYGVYLVLINVALNIFMSLISAVMFALSSPNKKQNKSIEATGYMPFLSVILGFFTFGCTSCMIGFLAALGITFGVFMLPLYNLPYKLLGLLLLMITFYIQRLIIKKMTCKI